MLRSLLALLLIGHCLSADVIAHFRGQMGNQFFQAAAALALALDHGCGISFPDASRLQDPEWGKNWDLRKNYFYFFQHFPHLVPDRPPSYVYIEPGPGYTPLPYQPNIEIDGFFISEKYFSRHSALIKQLYSAPKEIREDLERDFDWLIRAANTVAVHVRTGYYDYLLGGQDPSFYSRYLRPDLEFYKKAMELFPSDSLFVVFSDYIPWCKKHFEPLQGNFLFIENQDYLHDFFLLTFCKHAIIANSSFGWWGAYLNSNPEKRIICRTPFCGYPGEKTDDLVCDEWILVPGSSMIPFPDF